MKRILLSLLAAFLPGSLLAQRHNISLEPNVHASVIVNYNGRPALFLWWLPGPGPNWQFVDFHRPGSLLYDSKLIVREVLAVETKPCAFIGSWPGGSGSTLGLAFNGDFTGGTLVDITGTINIASGLGIQMGYVPNPPMNANWHTGWTASYCFGPICSTFCPTVDSQPDLILMILDFVLQ